MKDSLQLVLDKSATDDQLLDALKQELSRLRAHVQVLQTQQQQTGTGGGGGLITTRTNGGPGSVFSGSFRASGQGISTVGGSDKRPSAYRNMGNRGAGGGGGGGDESVADSLDFGASLAADRQQELQLQQQWDCEKQQYETELQRLRRLCKNQVRTAQTSR
jgi:hypothetical protein